jgi:hypothetical protein
VWVSNNLHFLFHLIIINSLRGVFLYYTLKNYNESLLLYPYVSLTNGLEILILCSSFLHRGFTEGSFILLGFCRENPAETVWVSNNLYFLFHLIIINSLGGVFRYYTLKNYNESLLRNPDVSLTKGLEILILCASFLHRGFTEGFFYTIVFVLVKTPL